MKLQPQRQPQSQEYEPQPTPFEPPSVEPEPDAHKGEILALLRKTIADLNAAMSEIESADDLPADSVTLNLDLREGGRRVDVFRDGTVLYSPANAESDLVQPDRVSYIVLGPAGKACDCCKGSGRKKQ